MGHSPLKGSYKGIVILECVSYKRGIISKMEKSACGRQEIYYEEYHLLGCDAV
jgi:hypothetical protein